MYSFILGCQPVFKSSRPEVLCEKDVLRNFKKFIGKHLCQSLFLNKVAGLRPANLLTHRLYHRCFPVNIMNFLRTPFHIEHLWWLLLSFRVVFEERTYVTLPLTKPWVFIVSFYWILSLISISGSTSVTEFYHRILVNKNLFIQETLSVSYLLNINSSLKINVFIKKQCGQWNRL